MKVKGHTVKLAVCAHDMDYITIFLRKKSRRHDEIGNKIISMTVKNLDVTKKVF